MYYYNYKIQNPLVIYKILYFNKNADILVVPKVLKSRIGARTFNHQALLLVESPPSCSPHGRHPLHI